MFVHTDRQPFFTMFRHTEKQSEFIEFWYRLKSVWATLIGYRAKARK